MWWWRFCDSYNGHGTFQSLQGGFKSFIRKPNELTKGNELAVILTDIDSRPIANQNIIVRITDSNGVLTQKSVITDLDGMARISLSDFAPGSYKANVTYNESFAFKASKTSQSFTISENASK